MSLSASPAGSELMRGCRALFQLFNTRLSRGGKVEECSTTLCKSDTICMMRSMRSESNCVRLSFLVLLAHS